jgi:hypothetical protein
MHEERFGLASNPAHDIEPALLVGRKDTRKRVLTDAELCAFWKAAATMGYPYGPLFQLLLLCGCRNTEAARRSLLTRRFVFQTSTPKWCWVNMETARTTQCSLRCRLFDP